MFKRKSKRDKVVIKIIVVFLIIFIIVFLPIIYSLSDHLSKTEKVSANILLVEGWLPTYALNMVYNEFQINGYEHIITTGLKFNTDYYRLPENGYLIFYLKNKNSFSHQVSQHIIEVDAYSELGGEHSAHFNLYVNDSLIVDFFADTHKRRYPIKWEGSLSRIDSLMVQFTNDEVGDFGHINLFVKEIVLDNKITIPYLNNSEYDISKLDGKRRIINNFSSSAQLARVTLLSMGIDSSRVIAIPGKRAKINRTLSSALAFRDWLKTSNIDVNGINIVSLGIHARRTYITYKKILGKSYNIGIISIPDNETNNSRKKRIIKTIRETFGIIYYWFILIPY